MTTVAFRDGVLAADTLVTANTHRDGSVTKIAKRGPVLAAAVGLLPFALAFLDWFRGGMLGDPPPMGNKEDRATGHIFTSDGWVLSYSIFGWQRIRAEYYANGSGSDYAYGAMAMGASAEDAVRAALIHETASGGEIQVLRI